MQRALKNWFSLIRIKVSGLLLVCVFVAGGFSPVNCQIGNYVVNPSFEDLKLAHLFASNDGVHGWGAIDTSKRAYFVLTVGPPKYNAPYAPTGFQFPRTGNNFILTSFFCSTCNNSGRWFPRNRLKALLLQGKNYCGRYYVVNTNNSPVGTSEYSMLFGGTDLDTITKCVNPLSYLSPQIVRQGPIIADTTFWTAITGTFVATGTEKYMVLGNFMADGNTQTIVINPAHLPTLSNDLYIDDVSLVEMELPAYAGNDTNIVFGDSLFLGRDPDVGIDYACQWYELPNDTVPIDTIAGLWVKPTKKTTYVVRQQLWCSGVKWDTVTVGFDVVGLKEDPFRNFRVYPSITSGKVNVCGLPEPGYVINLSDITGKSVARYVSSEKPCTELSLSLTNGMYFVTVSKDRFVRSHKIIVSQ